MNIPVRALTVRYVSALMLIALVITGGFAGVLYVLHASEGASAAINAAGRQRMLSQQIAWRATELADPAGQNTIADREAMRARLQDAIREMAAAHRALAHGASHPMLPANAPPTPRLEAVYFGEPYRTDAYTEAFLAAAARVAGKIEAGTLAPGDPDIEAVRSLASGPLLAGLEAAVRAYEQDADTVISRFEALELTLWLLLLALLAAESIFIFRPAVRRLQRDAEAARKAQEEDRRKTEWLELTQTIGRIGHWFVDLQAGQLYWSDEVYRIHGLSKEAGAPALDAAIQFYAPEDRASVETAIAEAIEQRQAFAFEKRLVRPDGQTRWVFSKGECRLNEAGEVVALFGIFQDVTERRQRNEEIRQTKTRYEIAMQSAAIGLWELDLTTRAHTWSDLIKTILGLPAAAPPFRRTDFMQRLHPADVDYARRIFAERLWERGAYAATFRLRHEDGHYVYVELRGDAVRDEDGEALRLAGSFSDVTEERCAQALRENLWDVLTEQGVDPPDKLQQLLSQATAYLGMECGLISRIEGDRYEVRYAEAPDLPIEPGDVFELGQTYCVHVLEAGAPRAFHHVAKSEIREHPCYRAFGLEAYIGAPVMVDGRRYGTLNFSSPNPRAKPFSRTDLQLIELIAQWAGYEIGRYQSLRSLKKSEERFALALEGSSVGIWDWVDVSGGQELWSDQFYRLLGYEPGEVEASLETFKRLLHPDDQQPTFEAAERHLQTGARFEVEYRLLCKNGLYRWFLGTGQAVWDAEGRPHRMIGSIQDIHERKQSEQMKSEFVATVSHELRTPMTSIMGAIGLVTSGKFGELEPRAQNLLGIAANNGQRLVRLINDILDISKIEAGRIEFAPQRVNAASLVRDAVNQNTAYAAQHGAHIVFEDRSDGAMIDADADRLIQVMTNLISNAAKFTGAGGRIEVGLDAQDEQVRIRVSDNGPGIPAEKREAIFDRFVQVDGRDSRAAGGTGLGLAIAKAIVEAHGGRINIDSELGEGATFTVTLAVSPPAGETGQQQLAG